MVLMSDPKDTERWSGLTAGDIMQPRVITVSYSAPVSEIERVLSDHRISGVPVCGPAGNIVGVVSMRDLIDKYVEDPDSRPRRGGGYYHLSVEDLDEDDFDSFNLPSEAEDTAESIMTSDVYSVLTTATLQEVARSMVEHKIHRVLVMDRETNRISGLITTMGVLAAISA